MASAFTIRDAAGRDEVARDAVVLATDVPDFVAVAASQPRISWSAVLAGIVLALAIESLLTLLGVGIGLSAMPPAAPDLTNLASNAALWSLGSTLLSLLLGGWAAARLAGVGTRRDGMLHGLMLWALAVLVTAALMATAAGSGVSLLGGLTSTIGGGLRAMLPPVAGDGSAGRQARSLLQPQQGGDLGSMSAADAQQEVSRLLPDLAAGGERATQAHDRIVDIMSVQLRISHDEAAHRLDEARAKPGEDAPAAADRGPMIVSRTALTAFAGLLAAAVVAGLGGLLARPRRTKRFRV